MQTAWAKALAVAQASAGEMSCKGMKTGGVYLYQI